MYKKLLFTNLLTSFTLEEKNFFSNSILFVTSWTLKLLCLPVGSNVLKHWFSDYRNHRKMADEKVSDVLKMVSVDIKRSEYKLNVHFLEVRNT